MNYPATHHQPPAWLHLQAVAAMLCLAVGCLATPVVSHANEPQWGIHAKSLAIVPLSERGVAIVSRLNPSEKALLMNTWETSRKGPVADYLLEAQFAIDLPPELLEALFTEVPLYFDASILITEPRWYWKDRIVFSEKTSYRLSYQAHTQQFYLYSGLLLQSFSGLDQALALLRQALYPVNLSLEQDSQYQIDVSLSLNVDRLPKRLQQKDELADVFGEATEIHHQFATQ